MVGLGECRSANIDGLPWQLSLLPTGYCNIRGETERPVQRKQGKCLASYPSSDVSSWRRT
ncbi:hypothetical protein BRY73_05685 [Ochrobactrum sp. P6BS-III]|nr:hypothetical protein [Ochrobactrum sp. P6BSIII]OOL19384.1 hypothetical protein BRY73_05685 [Ochrobactrum sp. P6BS-III]